MRKLAAIFLLTMIAGPAFAQSDHVQRYREEVEKSPADVANEARQQRAYQRALSGVPDQKPTDPWGIARSDGQGAPKANAAKPKPAKPTSAAAK
ncbi:MULTISPECIES: hypothetical protein [Bradyrhizobium]|jgi:hypothetical protein|uniref:hypothetical protein n=1 Tax=Bradyrhizobium TaxID=374 RepID=UPI000481C2EB|nr:MULTISPECIES: hypothetical protein [Bradyrhizobium]MCS3449726.1 hypothetical protein [Bradyrhizobium elkanii]MCS3559131.1 hypothetical protein [Bradyrhizobium elkanii]MCW2151023.1 hypothetical protein [Bradyrhizobium elkanii]MCW2358931.1 hypothetical protein [Bradyrhizobium elkanii]MCW2374754.1 hypothetical protein [Bradyrhizobium elkanii]